VSNLVVKVSGKVLNASNSELVSKYASVFSELSREHRIAVVVGGGPVAREYIEAGRRMGVGEGWLDVLGLNAARLNALLLISMLGSKAYPIPPSSVDDFLKAWATGRVVVLGGLQPGQSTNMVSAVVAELVGAKFLVNAASIDAVYDKDPSKHPEARRIEKITVKELREILRTNQSILAGGYELVDPLSLNILERSRITMAIVDGSKPENVIKAVRNGWAGTLVLPE